MGTAARCYTDEAGCAICSALHSRSLEIGNTMIKNYFVKCGFSNDVSSNDDSAVNSVKMKRMIGRVYNLLECSLSITQHVTVL
jgi:hypothetical protein